MADVKWIKLATSIFDNRKIRQIETLPDGYAVIVVWLKLLCLAGNVNDTGMIYLTKEIPYTEQMLAAQFNVPLTTMQLALKTFEQFGMIEVIDNMLHISNWEKYQSVDRLAEIREYNRLAQQKSRAKRKLLETNTKTFENVNDMSMTSQRCHDTDIDKEEDKELDLDNTDTLYEPDEDGMSKRPVSYKSIQDHYNRICVSFPKCTVLSDARKKAIKARFNNGRTEKDFIEVFEKAEASSFLKGGNDRNWQANFDWMIKETNFVKILDGNYADKKRSYGRKEAVPDWVERDNISWMKQYTKAKPDPALADRVAKLKQSLGSGSDNEGR